MMPRATGMRWLYPGQNLNVSGCVLPGMHYFNENGGPGFVIDLGLPAWPGPVRSLGGCIADPGCMTWTPEQRYAYLAWLAGGRAVPEPPAMIQAFCLNFFRNLEYRVVIDRDQDPRLLTAAADLLVKYAPALAGLRLVFGITSLF